MIYVHFLAKPLIRLARKLTKGDAAMPRKKTAASEYPISDAEIITPTEEPKMRNESTTPAGDAPAKSVLTTEQRQARLLVAETRVRDHMMVSLGVGLLPFPLLDLAAAVTTQVTLVKRLCDLYEVPFSESATRGIVTSLIGTLGLAGSALIIGASFSKLIPGSGTALGMLSLPLMSAAYTYAVGQLFIGHFEIGGTLSDFQSQKYSHYFRDLYARGKETAVTLMPKKKAEAAAVAAATAAEEIAPNTEPQPQAG